MNIVILWELSGIKSTEEQYIIAIYQIDTNYISVQVWSHIIYLVGGSGKTRIQIDNIPTLVMYIARVSIYRQVMSVIAIPCIR